MPPRQILDRLEILLTKGEELDKMTAADSDEIYKPMPGKQDTEDANRDKEVSEKVDLLIKRMEEEVSKPGDNEHIN